MKEPERGMGCSQTEGTVSRRDRYFDRRAGEGEGMGCGQIEGTETDRF
jgi:hypothetical protein